MIDRIDQNINMEDLPTWLQELWEMRPTLARRAEKHYLELTKQCNIDNDNTEKSKFDVSDIISMLPKQKEIENEANSYDNCMSSIAEGVWMSQGFKEGVEWVLKKLKENIN